MVIGLIRIGESIPVDYSKSVLQNLLLLNGWGTTNKLTWYTFSWSFSAEWFAYSIIFSICALVYKYNNRLAISLFCLIVVGFLIYWFNIENFSLDHYTFSSIPRILPEFILGVLTAFFH